MKLHFRRFLSVMILISLFASVALAQSLASGALDGTVIDASGAVVPEAVLTLLSPSTGTTFEAKTSNSGLYTFPVVPVGNYELTVTKAGFATTHVAKVAIQVGNKSSLNLTLKVASAGENVTVTDEAPVLETTRTSVADNVGEKTINNIPTNGRNFIDFALLTPGVTRDTRTGDISFAGQRGTLNSLTVDGADNNNTFFGQTTGRAGFKAPYQFSQDSVKEFQVASNGYSAELGRAGGAVINVVTKSGSNAFHGDAFEYYRDQSLNAYDPIQKQNFLINPANAGKPMPLKNKYHFNQFGGDIGGPIVKNKLFFFFDVDDQRNTTPNVVTPLPALTTFTSKAGLTAQDVTYITTGYNYLAARQASWDRTLDQNTYLLKVDANLSQRNLLSARWNRQRFTAGNQENGGSVNSLEHTGDSITHTDTATFSLTSMLTNSLINVARFTYLKDVEPGVANSTLPEAVVLDGGQSLLTVGRNSFSPRATNIHHEQYADNMTWVHGRTTVKFGGDAVVDKIFNYFPGNFFGAYRFNTLEAFGQSLSGISFPIGSAAVSYAQAFPGAGTTGAVTAPDILQGAGFVQGDWHVKSNLTLNAGLRYDIQSVKQPSTQNPAALALGFNTQQVPIKKNEWGPRFGFAYTPLGSQRFVVRGGYGLFYGTTPSLMIGTAHSNNGINVATYTLGAQPYSNPIYTTPAGGGSAAPSIYVFANDFQNPRVQQGNFGVDYMLDKNTTITANYLRVKGDHLQRTGDVNLGATTGQTITDVFTGQTFTYQRFLGARPYAGFQRISVFQSNAGSNYNGLSLELKRRFSSNFQGTIAWTWSHVIDNAPDATAVVPFSSGDDAKISMYSTDPNFDYGNGINDQRHRFVANFVWDLNYGKNLPTIARAIATGWTFSGILQAATGQPYSSVVGGDLNGDSNNNDRIPSLGRDRFTLPSTWEFDPRIMRTIKLNGETRNVQLFAEAFNLFNHFNVSGVRNTGFALKSVTAASNPCGAGYTAGQRCLVQQNAVTSPTGYFGLPTADQGPRTIQLGAKINF
jgi:Carboxypeptidase regulatory-like domain/TonB dependent receptor